MRFILCTAALVVAAGASSTVTRTITLPTTTGTTTKTMTLPTGTATSTKTFTLPSTTRSMSRTRTMTRTFTLPTATQSMTKTFTMPSSTGTGTKTMTLPTSTLTSMMTVTLPTGTGTTTRTMTLPTGTLSGSRTRTKTITMTTTLPTGTATMQMTGTLPTSTVTRTRSVTLPTFSHTITKSITLPTETPSAVRSMSSTLPTFTTTITMTLPTGASTRTISTTLKTMTGTSTRVRTVTITKTSTKTEGLPDTPAPTKSPTKSPTTPPTRNPSKPGDTSYPSKSPNPSPSKSPSKSPSLGPSRPGDTSYPSKSPIPSPTKSPTASPTRNPSKVGDTSYPTAFPTLSPSRPGDTSYPSSSPASSFPSASPTSAPSPVVHRTIVTVAGRQGTCLSTLTPSAFIARIPAMITALLARLAGLATAAKVISVCPGQTIIDATVANGCTLFNARHAETLEQQPRGFVALQAGSNAALSITYAAGATQSAVETAVNQFVTLDGPTYGVTDVVLTGGATRQVVQDDDDTSTWVALAVVSAVLGTACLVLLGILLFKKSDKDRAEEERSRDVASPPYPEGPSQPRSHSYASRGEMPTEPVVEHVPTVPREVSRGSKAPQPSQDGQTYAVGCRVLAQYIDGEWYTARIAGYDGVAYEVDWADGQTSHSVPEEQIRKSENFVPGDLVEAVHGDYYYRAVILNEGPLGFFHLRWEDETEAQEVPEADIRRPPPEDADYGMMAEDGEGARSEPDLL
eukprot:Hpha_TRINITY_DN15750_c0_g4::TRINITY_DN15750_c0_g4_i1::g.38129::m.38129